MKYPVGIDLDGVTADFVGGWTQAYSRDFPQRAPIYPSDIVEWDFLNLTHFGTWGHFWHWVREKHLFESLPPYPGAVQALGYIREQAPVVFITSRPMWAEEETLTWLLKVGLDGLDVHFNGSKGQVVCSVYVEDAPHTLAQLTSVRPDSIIYRMVRPWNSPIEGVRDLTRWDAITARVVIEAAREYPGNLGGA